MTQNRVVVRTVKASVVKVKTGGPPGARGQAGPPGQEWEDVGVPLDLTGLGAAVIGPFLPGYRYKIIGAGITADSSPAQLTLGQDGVFEYPPQISPDTTLAYVVGHEVGEAFPDPTIQDPLLWEASGGAAVNVGEISMGIEASGLVTLPQALTSGKAYRTIVTVDSASSGWAMLSPVVAEYTGSFDLAAPGVYEREFFLPGTGEMVDVYLEGHWSTAVISSLSFIEFEPDKITDTVGRLLNLPFAPATTVASISPANDLAGVMPLAMVENT